MYVDTDFIIALIKDDDWLGERAESLYEEHKEQLWTSHWTLLELMLVARRDGRDVLRTVTAAKRLIDTSGDTESVFAAASYVAHEDVTPFDALHLVASDDTIISSDTDYDRFRDRIALEPDDTA